MIDRRSRSALVGMVRAIAIAATRLATPMMRNRVGVLGAYDPSSFLFCSSPTTTAPAAEKTSDESLVGLIAKQDKRAMRVLFSRYNARVFRFLMRMVGNQATAEDLVSEVFIEVGRHAARFEARSRVGTWVLGIARYKALAALRRRPVEQLDDHSADSIEDPA
jgi:hypothetical protein